MLAAWGFFDWDMEALVCCGILHLLLRRGTAARDPLLDADMMCGYVCVCVSLSVGQEKCASEKQPSKSDPWSSFATPHTSFPSV